jgi:hypothetical protein
MSTLTASISLSSTDATSNNFSLAVTDALTIDAPIASLSRADVLHTGATQILASGVQTVITYVYLKNLDTTNFVTVKLDDATDFAVLDPGEVLFLPLKAAVGLEVQADTAACEVEYGYWTKG